MAHFAKLGTGNIVTAVHVVSNDVATTEQAGVDFINNLYGTNDIWKQTSYNTKGGVQITETIVDAQEIAKGMMGNTLITKQTGNEGKLVNTIYLEAGCEIDREYYLSILLDRNRSKLMLMVSDAGGVDIEDVADNTPERIQYVYFD